MAIHYRTQGFILKKADRGEADRLFTVYTKDFGKLEVLGKGLRKIKSKLRGGAEIFYLSEIEFIQGKTYKILTDAILIENFQNIRKDLKRLETAYLIAGAIDDLIKGQERDKKTWNLLNEVFQKLNNLSFVFGHLSLLYFYFLWNLISTLGYGIDLYHCVLCQKKLKLEKLYFHPEEGGIVCKSCFRKKPSSRTVLVQIGPEVVKILRIILERDWQTLKKLKIDKKFLKSLGRISDNYLNFLSEK